MQKSHPSIRRYVSGAVLAALTLLGGCTLDRSHTRSGSAVPGLVVASGTRDVGASFEALDAKLVAAEPIGVFARIDHAANAPSELPLRPTRLILFGNPKLGTPLMRVNQLTGIDLPQKILIYQDAAEKTRVAYNGADYLAQRYGVGNVATLPMIAAALKNFSETASGASAPTAPTVSRTDTVGRGEGLISVRSNADAATTFDRLRTAVAGNSALKVIGELDHAANATKVGLSLRPTRLLVFGNPALGTPLMRAAQTVAIDLPQKMLVYTDAADQTFVVYNDPTFIARRHGAQGESATIAKVAAVLAQLAAAAAGS